MGPLWYCFSIADCSIDQHSLLRYMFLSSSLVCLNSSCPCFQPHHLLVKARLWGVSGSTVAPGTGWSTTATATSSSDYRRAPLPNTTTPLPQRDTTRWRSLSGTRGPGESYTPYETSTSVSTQFPLSIGRYRRVGRVLWRISDTISAFLTRLRFHLRAERKIQISKKLPSIVVSYTFMVQNGTGTCHSLLAFAFSQRVYL